MNTALNDLTGFDPKKGSIAFGQSKIGKPFDDIEQIKKDFPSGLLFASIKMITVRTGVRIDNLSVTYKILTEKGSYDKTYTHGGRNGSEHIVKFSDSEELKEVYVMVGHELESVKFCILDKNTKEEKCTTRFGGDGGAESYYNMELPIIGFYGTADDYRITSLGLYCNKQAFIR